jgi:hypothetical protein
MNTIRNIYLYFLFLPLLPFVNITKSFGQKNSNSLSFDSIICREWIVKSCIKNGKDMKLTNLQKISSIIFLKNHTTKSLANGQVDEGFWSYDNKKNIMTIYDKISSENVLLLKIISINLQECVLEFIDSENSKIKMFLTPR